MVISFNTAKVTGGGGYTPILQQKKVTITENGLDVIIPDSGYDGLSTVYVQTKVEGGTGGENTGVDYSVIGYDKELTQSVNDNINAKIAYSQDIYDNWDDSITSMRNQYKGNTDIVYFPAVNTSNVTTMYSAFSGCTSLEYLPDLDTSNVKKYEYFVYNCYNLKRIPKISLKHIPEQPFNDAMKAGYQMLFNNQKVTYFGGFVDCEHITSWYKSVECIFDSLPALETVGEMGIIKSTISLRKCTKLTVESLMVFINSLYDFVGNGETTTNKYLYVGADNLAKLSDEQIAIATVKGWSISE